jgi:hypothetical protein
VQTVEFDVAAAKVAITLKAPDKTADWAWSDVRLVVEDL